MTVWEVEMRTGEGIRDLAVVRDQGLADHLARNHQLLQDLKYYYDHCGLPGVQGSFNRDDELRDDRQDLAAAVLEHVECALSPTQTWSHCTASSH